MNVKLCMKLFITIFFIQSIFLLSSCEKHKKAEKPIVAKIDGREITIEEFRSFYSFDVNFGLDSSGIDALNDELLFYIDQIKSLKRASEDGLINDSIFVKAYEWEKRQAILRQLYRLKVSENVTVSENEMRDLYRNEQTQIQFRHLFFKSQSDAEQTYKELLAGSTFEELALKVFHDDSLAKSGGNLDWIKMSDLDDEFAYGIYSLPVKTISKPVKSKWGYHVVEILDRRINPIISESEYIRSVPSLEKKIKIRKSQKLSADFIKNYIGELNPQLKPKMFEKMWNLVVPENEQEGVRLNKKTELSRSKIDLMRKILINESDQPLINYKGGIISFNSFLTGLEQIPMSHQFVFQSKRELSNQIGKWVRDNLLLKEAYLKNLDEHNKVISETNRFMEEQSYYYYLSITSDTMNVPGYVNDYFTQKDSAKRIYNPSLGRYKTIQEWKFEYSKNVLRNYLKNIKSDIYIDKNILQIENEKVTWDNKIRMFMVRKPS